MIPKPGHSLITICCSERIPRPEWPGDDDTAPDRTASRRRRGSGHELRTVLLHAATELLALHGDVNALTTRELATAAGVTPSSVYRHFPDKQSLVRAVITEQFTEFTAALRAAARQSREKGGTPLDQLEAVAHAYVDTGLAQPGHYRVLFSVTNAGPAGLGLDPNTDHPGARCLGRGWAVDRS